MGSGALSHNAGITVLSEQLIFDCDPPFAGKIDMGAAATRFARITASYNILASEERDVSTSFILVDELPVHVTINDLNIPSDPPLKIAQGVPRSFHTFDKSQYQASFRAHLKKGENTITIKYRQPLSVSEVSYGYFTKSKYLTYFFYEASPLREWILADDFHFDLSVSIPDDTGISKTILGSDYAIGITGEDDKKRTAITHTIRKTRRDILTADVKFGKDFPGTIIVHLGLKETVK
jgi:hypothetical protein